MIRTTQEKLNDAIDNVVGRYSRYLPFAGKYALLLKAKVNSAADLLVRTIEHGTRDGEDFDKAVDFLVSQLKKVPLPLTLFWIAPFKGYIVDAIGAYLKANKGVFAVGVIAMKMPDAE